MKTYVLKIVLKKFLHLLVKKQNLFVKKIICIVSVTEVLMILVVMCVCVCVCV